MKANVRFKFEAKTENNLTIISNIETPKYLYKYYSLDKFSNESLRDEYLFFSHPHLLNDVMDGSVMLINFENITYEFYEGFFRNHGKVVTKEIYLKDKENKFIDFTRCYSFINLSQLGVLSLSSIVNNNLLWTHYTNEKGYCIKLNSRKLELFISKKYKVKVFPVIYVEEVRQADVEEFSLNSEEYLVDESKKNEAFNIPIIYPLSTKEKCWKYEKEWRILIINDEFNHIKNPLEILSDYDYEIQNTELKSRHIKISKKIIEKIILAPYFFNNDRFNKAEEDNLGNRIYYFKNTDNVEIIKDFINKLYLDFNDRIYLIDKIIDENKIVKREIQYKMKILDLGESFVKVKMNRYNK